MSFLLLLHSRPSNTEIHINYFLTFWKQRTNLTFFFYLKLLQVSLIFKNTICIIIFLISTFLESRSLTEGKLLSRQDPPEGIVGYIRELGLNAGNG